MAGEFEGFSVHGKTPETGDGFSDDDTLGATEGAVEGIRVGAFIVGDNIGDSDPDHEKNTVGDEEGNSVVYFDG